MVWAFGKADHVAALLFEKLQQEFEAIGQSDRGLATFKPQELSNILWACAKTQHSAKSHFNKLEASARDVFTHARGGGAALAAPPEEDMSVVLEVDTQLFRYAQTVRPPPVPSLAPNCRGAAAFRVPTAPPPPPPRGV